MFIDHFIESSTVSLSSGGSSLLPFFEPQRLADKTRMYTERYSLYRSFVYLITQKKVDLLSRKKISRRKNGIQRLRPEATKI